MNTPDSTSTATHGREPDADKPNPRQVEATPGNQGEGDRQAARRFNDAQKQFVDDGRVPDAAERAAPHDAQEKAELERAEQQGRSRAKGDDPTVPAADAGHAGRR